MMLAVSIVLYRPNIKQLRHVVSLVVQSPVVSRLYLIDNTPASAMPPSTMSAFLQQWQDEPRLEYLHNASNIGYGKAHNIALRKSMADGTPYHLVLNADVDFSPSIFADMLAYMEQHQEVGQMMPKVLWPNGDVQYLCRLLPAPLDVFGRRFLPDFLMHSRNQRYQMVASGYNKVMNVPTLSGCFMLLRVSILEEVGLFDERYFLYAEDIDLTRRIHQRYQTLFWPMQTIYHEYGHGSYHSAHLLFVHIVNIMRYFNKWGWFHDPERTRFNRSVEQNYLK